jgi:hypothetical protein
MSGGGPLSQPAFPGQVQPQYRPATEFERHQPVAGSNAPRAAAPGAPAAGAGAGRSSTVWEPIRPSTPAAGDAAQPQAVAAPEASAERRRRIVGWMVSEDRLTAHTLHEGANRVGRDLKYEIVLNDPTVSEFHCNLYFDSGTLHVVPEVGIKNAVFVNGAIAFSPTAMTQSGQVKLGTTTWSVVLLPGG